MPMAKDYEGQCQFLENHRQNNDYDNGFLSGLQLLERTELTLRFRQSTSVGIVMQLIRINQLSKTRDHSFVFKYWRISWMSDVDGCFDSGNVSRQ
jgi:hypothetical protein